MTSHDLSKNLVSDNPRMLREKYTSCVRKRTDERKTTAYRRTSGQPQYEATKAYMPKEPDELGLQQAELVIVFQREEGKKASLRRTCFFSFFA